jgi:hypothetical protein
MPQGNSKTQNIFPNGNIFVHVQTGNRNAALCGAEATRLTP